MSGPLDKIRSKPLAYRRKFALISAATITACLFLAWLAYFSQTGFTALKSDKKIESVESFRGALTEFSDSLSQAVTEVKNGILQVATSTSEIDTGASAESIKSIGEIPKEN